ncbi:dihydropteroate synthase [Nocardia sp. R7R-8]|uniref:dihydropteroate synthase n=1 Tax=Nocardia sp. R7R-8 TaxID=3459304 RepID=UPI00403E02C1
MGIVNVTPDSFSDGGRYLDRSRAVSHALALAESGADIIDVGGESTRPGASRVSADDELRRVLPVVRELVRAGLTVSVDTTRSVVAEAALTAGARLVNDVSGGLADPAMARLVAHSGLPYVVMHWRAPSRDMQRHANYHDVVTEVITELQHRVDSLIAQGVRPSQIVLDPGLGFAKRPEHDWALLSRLGELTSLGFPVLVGASRKSFLGSLLTTDPGPAVPPASRDAASTAVAALAAANGASCVRVHDARSSLDAVLVADAWRRGGVPDRAALLCDTEPSAMVR